MRINLGGVGNAPRMVPGTQELLNTCLTNPSLAPNGVSSIGYGFEEFEALFSLLGSLCLLYGPN